MKRLSALLTTVGCVASQLCFGSSRLPDYDVTQIGGPGSGRYVFCTDQTCPEPTIKHLAVAAPIAPTTPTPFPLEIKPLPAATVSHSPPAHGHVRHAHRTRHLHRTDHTTPLPKCVDVGAEPSERVKPAHR